MAALPWQLFLTWQVTDNDVYSSGDVVSTRGNGAVGAEYMHVARNRLWNGGTTHWGISWKQCVFEDNVATGVATTAMGSNYPQYDHAADAPHVQNIYHHNNTQSMVWGAPAAMRSNPPRGHPACRALGHGRGRSRRP